MAGPLAGGGTGAVAPGGQAAATAASAVPRPSSGAAETAAATSPVDAIRFRRVRSWRFAGAPGSDVDEVIRIAFLGMMGCCDAGVARLWRHAVPSRAFTHAERACGCKPKHTYTRKQVNSFRIYRTAAISSLLVD